MNSGPIAGDASRYRRTQRATLPVGETSTASKFKSRRSTSGRSAASLDARRIRRWKVHN
jgi:hypothetical protein